MGLTRWVGRAIGVDVHRAFCEVAICEDGIVRSAGRVASTPEGIGSLADSLLASDRVALEVTGSSWAVARLLEPHVRSLKEDKSARQAKLQRLLFDTSSLAPPHNLGANPRPRNTPNQNPPANSDRT